MPQPKATLLSLPTEIISSIFTLSSNPALVFVCQELNHILAPLSKSLATRVEFLLVRYRNNYVKAIVKGLRWSFFDLELLHVLDRIYYRERTRIREIAARKALISYATTPSSEVSGDQTIATSSEASSTSSTSSTSSASKSKAPPKKKRKKYQLPSIDQPALISANDLNGLDDPSLQAAVVDASLLDREIPLPKDFSLPRRLFKSSDFIPLIQILLSRGASPSYPLHYPLVRASQRGDVRMVKLLLAFGAPPEMKALRWACVEEHDDVVDIFLENGVRPDGQCLSWCVEKGKTKMIDRLLKLGVVPDLKTHHSRISGNVFSMVQSLGMLVYLSTKQSYPAYASYKAINSRNSTRLTAWLMYWTVMGLFHLVEFVLDMFIFWLPFYYEIKLLFILWMIMPQTQGSIYLYQAVVDPYLAQHEGDIDKALKDMQKQAMTMGMQYVKQAIQMLQNLAFDLYKKSQNQAGTSSLTDQGKDYHPTTQSASGVSSLGAASSYPVPPQDVTTESAPTQSYLSWAYHALPPKLAAVATMATERATRHIPARPLAVSPVNLYSIMTPSTSSNLPSREPATAGNENNVGISSSSTLSVGTRAELEQLSSRLSRAAETTGVDTAGGTSSSSLRNRKISLYEDETSPAESEASSANHSTQASDSHTSSGRSWSSYASSFGGSAPAHTPE
ncbi:receptor accessory protein 4 [Mortierella claussenii]|nr:receptor accessory protein 4 [Mortierella claussenii]